MSATAIESNAPTASRTITALAKIPPAIIAAAAALGAYQAAPLLVERFSLSDSLHTPQSDTGAVALPTQMPIRPARLPPAEPIPEQVAPPVVPPVAHTEETPAASIVAVEPRAAAAAVTTGVIIRPAIRRQFVRTSPPHLAFARRLSGVRGMIRLGHVVQLLQLVRRFHR